MCYIKCKNEIKPLVWLLLSLCLQMDVLGEGRLQCTEAGLLFSCVSPGFTQQIGQGRYTNPCCESVFVCQ